MEGNSFLLAQRQLAGVSLMTLKTAEKCACVQKPTVSATSASGISVFRQQRLRVFDAVTQEIFARTISSRRSMTSHSFLLENRWLRGKTDRVHRRLLNFGLAERQTHHAHLTTEVIMLGRFSGAVVLFCASLSLDAPALAAAPGEFTVTNSSVVTAHVKIVIAAPYTFVKSRLEAEVRRFDDSYRKLLQEDKIDELRQKLAQDTIHQASNDPLRSCSRQLVSPSGELARQKLYYVGNVLSASEMTQVDFGAALYAPLRLNVYENAQGGTTFEYDKPSTQFGQFAKPCDRQGCRQPRRAIAASD